MHARAVVAPLYIFDYRNLQYVVRALTNQRSNYPYFLLLLNDLFKGKRTGRYVNYKVVRVIIRSVYFIAGIPL